MSCSNSLGKSRNWLGILSLVLIYYTHLAFFRVNFVSSGKSLSICVILSLSVSIYRSISSACSFRSFLSASLVLSLWSPSSSEELSSSLALQLTRFSWGNRDANEKSYNRTRYSFFLGVDASCKCSSTLNGLEVSILRIILKYLVKTTCWWNQNKLLLELSKIMPPIQGTLENNVILK